MDKSNDKYDEYCNDAELRKYSLEFVMTHDINDYNEASDIIKHARKFYNYLIGK